MKIVHIEDFFHPNAGYQINILPKYMVKQGHQVTIITSDMEKIPQELTSFFGRDEIKKHDEIYTETTGVEIIRLPLKAFISGRAVFEKSLYKKVNELSPDILYVHGNDTLTGIKFLLKKTYLSYPMVMDSHMLEMASKNPFNKLFRGFYRSFIAPIIKRNEIKVIRTQDDDYVQRCLGIPLSLCPWISVGSDTLLFHPDENVKKKIREQNNIKEDDFVVVYTGKLDDSKGGKLLAETFKKKIVRNKDKNIVLLVVGNSQGEYGIEVEDIFNKSEHRVIRYPTQKYIDLPQFYQAGDLCIFPKQCSLSFYDAQACGLPVISEDNNINDDRLKFNNGATFRANDVEDFRKKIKMFVEMDESDYQVIKRNAVNYVKKDFDYNDIAQLYTDVLINEQKRFEK